MCDSSRDILTIVACLSLKFYGTRMDAANFTATQNVLLIDFRSGNLTKEV